MRSGQLSVSKSLCGERGGGVGWKTSYRREKRSRSCSGKKDQQFLETEQEPPVAEWAHCSILSGHLLSEPFFWSALGWCVNSRFIREPFFSARGTYRHYQLQTDPVSSWSPALKGCLDHLSERLLVSATPR